MLTLTYVDFLTEDGDFKVVGEVLEDFGKVSGSKVNKTKSVVLFTGAWAFQEKVPGGFSVAKKKVKILGVVFEVPDCAKANRELWHFMN